MNPEACLLGAETAIMDGEERLAADALDCYVNWRRTGGFEPVVNLSRYLYHTGDAFHKELIQRYEEKFGFYLNGRLCE